MAGLLAPMQDLLRPIIEQLDKLWTRVDLTPVIRWGTVTQAGPLRVQLDGDAEPLPLTPQTTLPDLRTGDRVVCVEQHRRVIVLQAAGLRETRALPAVQHVNGASSFIVTGGAGSWQAGASMTITPESDMWVDVEASAMVAASTNQTTLNYTMIGVNISGGVTLAPDAPPDGGPTYSHWTPFTFATGVVGMKTPVKRVLLPAGIPTTFTFHARRNAVPSSGSNIANYAQIQVRPVRWA
ncbi:hypothetical protein [Microbacterium paraoxydans]|uniref:hypothetical protein n=1 Tax=Microbacterium paraoxydans TaxID=199592 RepID=UPI003D737B13